MTHIVIPERYRSKKAFREAVAVDPDRVFVSDPSLFDPISGSVREVGKVRGHFNVTNHPKRSWFATVTRKDDGTFKVT